MSSVRRYQSLHYALTVKTASEHLRYNLQVYIYIHSEGPDAVPCDPACKSEDPGLIQRQQLFINYRIVHSRASTQLTSIRAT